jgi:hypothetical protein
VTSTASTSWRSRRRNPNVSSVYLIDWLIDWLIDRSSWRSKSSTRSSRIGRTSLSKSSTALSERYSAPDVRLDVLPLSFLFLELLAHFCVTTALEYMPLSCFAKCWYPRAHSWDCLFAAASC